jgi:hypothetical protein
MAMNESRRSLLKAAAAIAASTAAVPALATAATEGVETPQLAEPDRIFALIERHRQLYKAYGDAIEAYDDLYGGDTPECPIWRSLKHAADVACDRTCAAERALIEIGATTPAGWAALLRYEDEHRRAGGEFVDLGTGEKWRNGLLRRMAASLDGKPAWKPISQALWPDYGSVEQETAHG